MIDRRAEPRVAVNIPAIVIGFTDPTDRKHATIVDWSAQGAQLHLETEMELPCRVWLLELENNKVYGCKVRWNRGQRIGLQIHAVRPNSALQTCRTLLQQQPAPIARKIGRMIDRVETAIQQNSADLVEHLQLLIEAARFVSMVRRSHSGSKALYEQTALLLSHYGKLPRSFH